MHHAIRRGFNLRSGALSMIFLLQASHRSTQSLGDEPFNLAREPEQSLHAGPTHLLSVARLEWLALQQERVPLNCGWKEFH